MYSFLYFLGVVLSVAGLFLFAKFIKKTQYTLVILGNCFLLTGVSLSILGGTKGEIFPATTVGFTGGFILILIYELIKRRGKERKK